MTKAGSVFEGKERPPLNLSSPTIAARDSYLQAVREFGDAGEWTKEEVDEIEDDFEGWVRKLNERAEAKGLKEGEVPSTIYWLLENEKYVGSIQIRHKITNRGNVGYAIRPSERQKGYGTKMLAMALTKAAEMGIPEAVLTCDENNTASRKVIEENGGKLIDCTNVENNPVPVCRYTIAIKQDL